MKQLILFVFFFALTSTVVHAELSNEELISKCYGHLTGEPLSETHPLFIAASNGSNAVDLCISLLNQAALDSNGMLISTAEDSIKVLNNMNEVHREWFPGYITEQVPNGNMETADIYDVGAPAYHFTRALLQSNVSASAVVLSPLPLEGVRLNARVNLNGSAQEVGVWSNQLLSDFGFMPITPMNGRLTGIQPVAANRLDQTITLNGQNFALNQHRGNGQGGGFLGEPAYVLMNLANFTNRMTGGQYTARRWVSATMKAAFCRDMPVIRMTDAIPYVRPTSTHAFFQSTSCVRCHQTLDRLGDGLRNFQHMTFTATRSTRHVFRHPATNTSNRPADGDNNDHLRSPNWILYFRSHDGSLKQTSGNDLGQMGQTFSQLDDLYLCMAKRYFKYFTGMNANTDDSGDAGFSLSSKEAYLRDEVIDMGLNLKADQNLKNLIRRILEHPVYQERIRP